ncbi:MAG: helix-turn-helix domain-containing protein [Bauldia sp.]|nr:helix-turn-helix domain-containing protein [Bauldia sp.]
MGLTSPRIISPVAWNSLPTGEKLTAIVRFLPLRSRCGIREAWARQKRLWSSFGLVLAVRALRTCPKTHTLPAPRITGNDCSTRLSARGQAVNLFGHLPVVFDSAGLAERDRLGFASEEYGRKALKVALEVPSDAPFRLKMHAESYGGARVAVIQSTPYRVLRTRGLIDDGDDRLGLVFPLAGRFGGEQSGKDVSVGRGEATVMVSDRIGWFGTASGGTFLTIRIAPELIESLAPDVNLRRGLTIRPSRLAFDLIRAYLSTLNRGDGEVSPHVADVAGRHLAEIAAIAITTPDASPRSPVGGEGLRAARAAAARVHMAAHFTDPGYDVGTCASQLGISVRYLQAILEEDGTRFGEELKKLRLDHARALLADPANDSLRVTDIAFDSGFSDLSHFTRQFRLRFGESPTSVRGETAAGHR